MLTIATVLQVGVDILFATVAGYAITVFPAGLALGYLTGAILTDMNGNLVKAAI